MNKIILDASALTMLFKKFGPEFELEVRNGVLNEACRKHVKSILDEDTIKQLQRISREAVNDGIGEIRRTDSWKAGVPHLKPEFAEKIRALSDFAMYKIISEKEKEMLAIADEKIKFYCESLKEQIDNKLDKIMVKMTNKYIDDEVNRRLSILK